MHSLTDNINTHSAKTKELKQNQKLGEQSIKLWSDDNSVVRDNFKVKVPKYH